MTSYIFLQLNCSYKPTGHDVYSVPPHPSLAREPWTTAVRGVSPSFSVNAFLRAADTTLSLIEKEAAVADPQR
jgi:hypothetical protein